MPILTLLLATQALANGGPIAWTEPTASGGLLPREAVPVRLVTEDLRITMDADGSRYHAGRRLRCLQRDRRENGHRVVPVRR